MFTFKTKAVVSAIIFLIIASLGVVGFANYEKIKVGSQATKVNQTYPDSNENSSSNCSPSLSCSDTPVKEQVVADLNVVSSSSSTAANNSNGGTNNNKTTIKGILNNMEIADKGKSFVISSKENSLLQLQFSSQQALELAKKYDKSVVSVSGNYKADIFIVDSLSPDKLPGQTSNVQTQSFTGQNKFATILCKFSDDPTEGQTPAWFQNRMEGAGLDSTKTYWNEISDGTVNVSGGQVFGWFTLPHPRSYYVSPITGDGNVYSMFQDCTGVADSSVYFPNYNGVNLFFNNTIDSFAAGLGTQGRWGFYLDNNQLSLGVTWIGNNGWNNSNVIQHELGHTAGLPHSSSLQDEYGSKWDLMSFGYGFESGITGAIPAGMIAYYRYYTGLIPEEQVATVDLLTDTTYKLGQVNQYIPASDTKRMLIIPINSHQFYTVESRKKVGFDKYIPEAGVLIHNVDTYRQNWAFVEDIQNDNNVNNTGSVLRLNETYVNTTHKFMVKVVGDYTSGFQVRVVSTNPVVNVTSPSSRLLTGANYTFTASASDGNGTISKVEFYKSGVLVATDTTAPYQTDLNNLGVGEFILTARAYDNDGLTSNSNVVNLIVSGSNNFSTSINGINLEYTHVSGQLRWYGTLTDYSSCGKILNVHVSGTLVYLQREPSNKFQYCKQTVTNFNFDRSQASWLSLNQLQNFNSLFLFSNNGNVGVG